MKGPITMYLRFNLIKPALSSVHNASQTKIAEVKIQADGPPEVTPARRLTTLERRGIPAFAVAKRKAWFDDPIKNPGVEFPYKHQRVRFGERRFLEFLATSCR